MRVPCLPGFLSTGLLQNFRHSILTRGQGVSETNILELEQCESRKPRRTKWEGTAAAAASSLGLNIRVFWRWVSYGENCDDLLPVSEPWLVPAWHQRMRDRGELKHRLPDDVREKCLSARPSVKAPAVEVEQPAAVFEQQTGETSDAADITGPSGMVVEMQCLEVEVANARQQRDKAGDESERRRLDGIYQDKLKLYSKLKSDMPRQMAASEEFMRVSDFDQEHASIVINMVQTLNTSLVSAKLHKRVCSNLPVDEFKAIVRNELRACLRALKDSKFAPPLDLEAA